MRPNLLIKMLTIGGLMLVLVVPLLMIQGKISERESEAWQVGDQIARQISGEQQLGGPMIVVPRTVRSWSEKPDCEGSGCMTVRHHIELDSLIPDSLSLDGDMQTEMRYRGIYGVPVYRTLLHLEAVFPANWREPSSDARVVSSSSPLLLFQIRDLRGLVERPQVLVNDVPLALMEAEQLPKGVGTHAIAVALPDTLQGAFTVKIRLNLNGTQSFGMLPLAKETRMALRSDWPHPSFEGLVLPVEREISDAGFTSQWRTNSLAAASAIHCARGDAACGDADISFP